MSINARFTFTALAVSLAALAVSPAPAVAGDTKLELSLDTELRDAYVWRGQVLTDGTVAQPALTASYGSLSASVWGNLVLDSSSDETGQFSEVDYVLAYGFGTERVGLEAGLTSFTFPNASIGSTVEAHVAAEILGLPVGTGLSLHYDIDEAEGFYANLSVGKAFAVGKAVTLGLGFTAGWASDDYNAFYFGLDDSRANDGSLLVESRFDVRGDLGLSVGVQYSWLWDSEIESGARSLYADDRHLGLVFGLSHAF